MKPRVRTILVCLLVLVGCVVVIRCPRTVPWGQCGKIYRHYAGQPHIDATFIKDYKVDDSVAVDVTLLESRDSVGWAMLKEDFLVADLDPEAREYVENDKKLVFVKRIPKNTLPKLASGQPEKYDLLAVSRSLHHLVVFHITNDEERLAVIYHNLFDLPSAEGKLAFTMPRQEKVCCEETNLFDLPGAEGKFAFTMPRQEKVCPEETNHTKHIE